MIIEYERDYSIIKGNIKIDNPDLIYILVERGEKYGEDRFFLMRKRDMQNQYYKAHKQWLKTHGDKRPINPRSTHCGFSAKEIERFENNWSILEEEK